MRRFALGCLGYDPLRFGLTRVGDLIDAMNGYNEAESERIRAMTELLRTSTSILVNIQLAKEDRIRAQELWPLPWDKKEEILLEEITEEERQERLDKMRDFLNKVQSDGSGNK